MKPLYLNEIQREGLDVMLFHHHGGPTMQYINGYENGSGINLSIENAKYSCEAKCLHTPRNMGVKLLSKNMPSSMGCLKVGVRKLSMRRK